jgi:uncharacterized protein (DUF2252 family)
MVEAQRGVVPAAMSLPARSSSTYELTPQERAKLGRSARSAAPRSSHGEWRPRPERADPVELLERQGASRVPELLPIRYGRMVASPFTFFRGAAAVMAEDLTGSPDSGIRVQLSGDAHLSNFGGFASPERELVFDLNDFDETAPGPWEWDLKRLVTSIEIAARGRRFAAEDRSRAVLATVRQYREAMGTFAGMGNLDIWYAQMKEGALAERLRMEAGERQIQALRRSAAKARRKDNTRAFKRLAQVVDGEPQIVSDPPLVVRIDDLLEPRAAKRFRAQIDGLIAAYRATLRGDLRSLIDRYRIVDVARKVVGVGSVGTRAWIVLLLGRDERDPLFLQCKEAQPSVLEPALGAAGFENHGRRVVEGQRLMQACSDTMLGWLRVPDLEGQERDYYIRQLWDWKTSADVQAMDPEGMELYGRMCGYALARAHARSGDPIAISSYLGRSETFDRAIQRFAGVYAEQNERDHKELAEAIADGQIQAELDA